MNHNMVWIPLIAVIILATIATGCNGDQKSFDSKMRKKYQGIEALFYLRLTETMSWSHRMRDSPFREEIWIIVEEFVKKKEKVIQ